MSTVYLVTCGSYSDYCVRAVFSTEARAKEYISSFESWYNIEEFGLYELPPLKRGLRGFIDLDNGSVGDLSEIEVTSTEAIQRILCANNRLTMYFDHDDQALATKVLAEKRAQVLVLYPGANVSPRTYPCYLHRDTLEVIK